MATKFSLVLLGAAAVPSVESNDASGWIVAILILAGGALLLLETVLPGLIAGIIGIICLLAAVILGYSSFGARTGNLILLGVGLGLVAGALCWVKYFPESRMAKIFVSQGTVGDLGVERPSLLEQTGVAQSDLRPSGVAMIKGLRVDVVAEAGLIPRGSPVKVVAVEGAKVVVRAVT